MMFWIAAAAGLVVAYLLGATPTGYVAGRLLKDIDIRQQGSGSTGATNVLRTLGVVPFCVVLAIDVLKGAAAVVFALWFYAWLASLTAAAPPVGLAVQTLTPWAACLAGLAALIGHSRSIWLGFTGGKSAAAGLGVLTAMAWPVAAGALAVFGLTLALTRIMSLGSMLAALTAVVLACVLDLPLPYRLMVIAGGLFVILLHRGNIQRILAGTEPKVGQRAAGT